MYLKNCILFILIIISFSTKAQYNYYYGNLHSHSSYSDGNKDSTTSGYYYPGQDFYYAKVSFHMDFEGISEHNHYSSLNNPGMHVADYAKGMYQADTANVDGSFVCMFGFEWGIISNGGHVVTYGVPGLVGWETGSGAWGSTNNYDIFCAKSVYTNFWPIINSYPNAFCTLAHPQWGDYNNLLGAATTYNTIADDAIAGVAIRSGGAFSTTTNYSDAAASLYDTSYVDALAKGYHVGPTIDHDNHNSTFGRTNHGRTVVLANALTRNDIMGAYRANRFFASDDWDAKVSFTVNGNEMGSDINIGNNAALKVNVTDLQNNIGAADPIKRIDIFYGVPESGIRPTLLTTISNSNILSFTHPTLLNSRFYYFAKITELDNDIIWTAPVWVKNTGTTLPTNFISFNAIQNQKNITLQWSTAQEINSNYFEVQRSEDGIHFYTIDSVASLYHNTSAQSNYIIEDKTINKNIFFYRIKEVSYTGSFIYSTIVSIRNVKSIPIIVFPNPVKDLLQFNFTSIVSENILCKIYSAEGREVKRFYFKTTIGSNTIKYDIANLTKGIYFLEISKPDERIAETNFIKE